MTKSNTQEFINKASKIHNNKYDYSNVEYIKSSYKVEILCNHHGIFFQTPNSHLKGKGLPNCANNVKYDLTTFIFKSKEIHNDNFNYSNVIYIDRNTKVLLKCNICNSDIYQTPRSNLSGNGCNICSGNLKTNEMWLNDFNKIHKGFYDYSNITEDIKSHIKINIICPIHGQFFQTARKHMTSGCKFCGDVRRNLINEKYRYLNKPTKLYYVKINNYFKIGICKGTIEERFKRENIYLEIIDYWDFENGEDALKLEQIILSETTEYRIDKNESPISSGWSELRFKDIYDIILEKLK